MWTFGTNSDDPNVVFAASRYGYLYAATTRRVLDKLRRELSEIAAVLLAAELTRGAFKSSNVQVQCKPPSRFSL